MDYSQLIFPKKYLSSYELIIRTEEFNGQTKLFKIVTMYTKKSYDFVFLNQIVTLSDGSFYCKQ